MSISVTRTIIYLYYYTIYFFLRIAFSMGLYTPTKLKTFLDVNNKYTLPLTEKFIKTFENKLINFNENIDPIFYDKTEFSKCIMEAENELEKIWKTRILFENTPRGNIIMFYDSYKLGFSFLCDDKIVSYDILNVIAMKYVMMYRCRDFFIDESITPVGEGSPFIKIHFLEEPTKKENVNKYSSSINPFINNRPYVKNIAKNPQIIEPIQSNIFSKFFKKEKSINIEKKEEPEKMKNKFLYLGKINNFKFTQFASKKYKVLSKFRSPLLENIILESGVQRERITYKDFKKSFVNTVSFDNITNESDDIPPLEPIDTWKIDSFD